MIGGLHRRAARLKATLWTLAVPPTVWALHFLFCYVWAAVRCAKRGPAESIGDIRIGIAVATVVALIPIVASGYIAWAQSRTEGDPPPHNASTGPDRLRFIAYATLLLAGLSFVSVLFVAAPALVFTDCR